MSDKTGTSRSPTKTVTCECGCPSFTLEVKVDLFGTEVLDLSCVDCGSWRVGVPTKEVISQKVTVTPSE